MLTQVVDFPTPPFPLATAKTRAHEASEGREGRRDERPRRGGGGRERATGDAGEEVARGHGAATCAAARGGEAGNVLQIAG